LEFIEFRIEFLKDLVDVHERGREFDEEIGIGGETEDDV